jgi:hypothetical protein
MACMKPHYWYAACSDASPALYQRQFLLMGLTWRMSTGRLRIYQRHQADTTRPVGMVAIEGADNGESMHAIRYVCVLYQP